MATVLFTKRAHRAAELLVPVEMVILKRVYEPAVPSDGRRILVDRLWPRGLTKPAAAVDEWLREIAPSTELRKWFGHDPKKWTEFRRRYRGELRSRPDAIERIAKLAARGRVTLLFGAKDSVHNDAVVLAEVLRARMTQPAARQERDK